VSSNAGWVAPPQLASVSPRLLARATLRRNRSTDTARVATIGDGRSLVPLMRRLDAQINAVLARRPICGGRRSGAPFGAPVVTRVG
jgi:hypothetical protein